MLQGDLTTAEKCLISIQARCRYEADRYEEAKTLLILARLQLFRERYIDELRYLDQCLSICSQDKYNQITLDTYTLYIQIVSALGNRRIHEKFLTEYIDLKNIIYGATKLANVSSRQAELKTRDNLHLLEHQKYVSTLQQKIIEQRRSANILVGVIVGVVFWIVWLLFDTIRHKKQMNSNHGILAGLRTNELEAKQIELEKNSIQLRFELDALLRELHAQYSTTSGVIYLSERH